MKTIGLIGGMSWESTAIYYRLVNERVKQRLGGLHSARLLLWSFDFAEIAALQSAGNWPAASERMVDAAARLKRAGADAVVICTNTMHLMVPDIEREAGLPVLHIADAAGAAIRDRQLDTVGLLATRFTMEQDFYKARLAERHGIATLIPSAQERATVHEIIYDELCRGVVTEASRQAYLRIIEGLVGSGAQGVVLGCTEIGMLIRQEDVGVPVFDTTILHAQAAADFALDARMAGA